MDIRVTLQRPAYDHDSQPFAEFLKDRLVREFRDPDPGRPAPAVAIEFGNKHNVMVNGLENTEDAWQVWAACGQATLDYQQRRNRAHAPGLFDRVRRGMI